MKKRIFAAVFITSLAVLIFGMLCVLLISEVIVSSDVREKLDSFTADLAAGQNQSGELPFILNKKFGLFRVTLIHPDGTVYYDSFSKADELKNHLNREEVQEALHSGSGFSERYSDSLDKRIIYRSLKLESGDILRCAVTSETVLKQISTLAYVMFGIVVFLIIISAVLARLLTEKIVRPVNHIDLNHPLQCEVYDELSPLIGKISEQQRQIGKQIDDIRQQSQEFMLITESMTEGLMILNPNVEIVSINHSAREFLNVERDCIGKSLLTVDRSSFARDLFAKQSIERSSNRTIERDGNYYLIFFNRIVVDEIFKGYALLLVDITQSRLAEKQRQEFTANVSHELKTPLQSIIGSAELLEKNIVKTSDIPSFATRIREKSLRLLSLINDIIFLSRLDEGRSGGETTFSTRAVGFDVIQMLEDRAASRNITFEKNIDDIALFAVYQYLHALIYNLCDNAIKYNQDGGRVELVITDMGDMLSIKVSDNGIGIPEDSQSRVFERFFRVDRSHSVLTEGTGLGLSIVKRIVRFYDGELKLSSKEGQGSEFTVLLPFKNLKKNTELTYDEF